jgi:hypothetical protein
MKFSKTITISAPAGKVWDVLGRDFANVGTWATGVTHSAPNVKAEKVNGSHVGGRICQTDFGEAYEDFTSYDDENMTFSFKGVFKSKMFNNVINSAKVTSIDANTAEVSITPEIKLSFLGTIMSPLIRMQFGKAIDVVIEDLKYFVENGEPSPTKVTYQSKQQK